ncbi:protein FAM227B-like isoform X2 [Corticium candelabrum]|nr:protein FAM227B-like isoform X2 [Corticium candelabrum]
MAGRAATKKKLSVSESGKTCSETVCDTKHQQSLHLQDKVPSVEPALVELAEFPGYNEHCPTPLPESLDSTNILQTVIRAQADLQRKPTFKQEWMRLFLSDQSESIFLDCFWVYFLQKFQPDQYVHDKLFHRTAFNYIELLQLNIDPQYREPFFKRYPDCISQAVYHSFFIAYPTSYQQFGEDFKTGVCNFVHLWLTGIQPVPRFWLTWNFGVLEPVNMYKIVADQEKSKENELVKARNIDVHQMLGLPHDISSQTNLAVNQSGSAVQYQPSDSKSISSSKDSTAVTTKGEPATQRLKENAPGTTQPISWTGSGHKKQLGQRHSCPIGQGPEFDRSLFNVNGHSPLVAYYLSVMRASRDTEVLQLMQRTEITKLPPLDSKTYSSLVRESMKFTRETGSKCQSLWEDKRQETGRLHFLRAADRRADIKKAEKLLAQTKEVKWLSNLLSTELLQQNVSEENRKMETAAAEIAKGLLLCDGKVELMKCMCTTRMQTSCYSLRVAGPVYASEMKFCNNVYR